jgi:predicted small lipoprotein YifL
MKKQNMGFISLLLFVLLVMFSMTACGDKPSPGGGGLHLK